MNYLWNNNQHYLEDKKRAKNSGYTENSGFGKYTNVGMTETINLLTYGTIGPLKYLKNHKQNNG